GFALALLGTIIFGGATYAVSRAEINSADWVAHTQQVLASLESVRSAALDAESSGRRFLITGLDLNQYLDRVSLVQVRIEEFKAMTTDNGREQLRAAALAELVTKRFADLTHRAYNRQYGGYDVQAGLEDSTQARSAMTEITAVITAATAEETQLLDQ